MGTVEGLEELYRERYARFCRLIAAVTGDAELAHDAVQSGFARALSSASSWRGEGSLVGWVWRIVLNCARDARAAPSVDLAVVVDLPAVVAELDPVLAEAGSPLRPSRCARAYGIDGSWIAFAAVVLPSTTR